MTLAKIRKCKELAQNFVAIAETVEEEVKASEYTHLYGTKNTGALRRRSMDLTRALAEMRK